MAVVTKGRDIAAGVSGSHDLAAAVEVVAGGATLTTCHVGHGGVVLVGELRSPPLILDVSEVDGAQRRGDQ